MVGGIVEAEAGVDGAGRVGIGDNVASTVRVEVEVDIVVSSEAAGNVGVVASTVRVDVIVDIVVSSEAAGKVGIGDDVANTVRVDVVVDNIVCSEAEAKGEPADDAGADGAELPELTGGLGLQVLRSLGVLSPFLFRAERAACLSSAARCAGSILKLCPAWATTATVTSTARSDTVSFKFIATAIC